MYSTCHVMIHTNLSTPLPSTPVMTLTSCRCSLPNRKAAFTIVSGVPSTRMGFKLKRTPLATNHLSRRRQRRCPPGPTLVVAPRPLELGMPLQ